MIKKDNRYNINKSSEACLSLNQLLTTPVVLHTVHYISFKQCKITMNSAYRLIHCLFLWSQLY